MKFPRNARIFRGQLDAAPFAAVLFLLVLFLMLGSRVYTPGVRLQLPVTGNLPGTDKPTVAVAIDGQGRFYYENQVIEQKQLAVRLRQVVQQSSQPLALLIQADKSVSYDQLMGLTIMARDVGIMEAWLATLPRALAPAP